NDSLPRLRHRLWGKIQPLLMHVCNSHAAELLQDPLRCLFVLRCARDSSPELHASVEAVMRNPPVFLHVLAHALAGNRLVGGCCGCRRPTRSRFWGEEGRLLEVTFGLDLPRQKLSNAFVLSRLRPE